MPHQFTKSRNIALQIFGITLGITLVIWTFRGLGILTFIPGGVIWLLILLAVAAAIWSRVQRYWDRF